MEAQPPKLYSLRPPQLWEPSATSHISSPLWTRGEQTWAEQRWVRRHQHVPLGTAQPTPRTQGCAFWWRHPGALAVPWALWPLCSLLSSGEKSSMFTTTPQFKEETLLAHTPTPKTWQCNQPVSPAACQACPSATSIFFPHLLDCINMKNNIRKFVVMGLEFLSQVYFNTCRILDIHWAIYRDRVTKKALYFWKPQGHEDRLSELLSLPKLLAKETSKHHASL